MDTAEGSYYLLAHASLPDSLLRYRDCSALLVCPSVFLDSRAEFPAVCGRDVRVANLELLCRRPDYFLGDISVLVAPRCARQEDCRVVARTRLKPSRWAVTCTASLPVETP